MEVNDALVEKLADLSKLHFNDAEKLDIKNDLQKMIQFITKLEEVNTENVEPLLHIGEMVNVLREDIVITSISQQQALQNAPEEDESFFKVPKVIRKEK